MRNSIITIFFVFLLSLSSVYAQVGMYSESINANAEMEIVSTTNNKGVLIPRMTTANIFAITSPATGLLAYSTDNNTFFFYNGSTWERIGQNCNILIDTDLDTKIEVDDGADNDTIQFTGAASSLIIIDSTGIIQNLGDLIKTNGNVVINNDYTLPVVDGTANDVLITDGAGTLSWQDPATLPGLIAGIVTFPLVCGREMNNLGDKAWYTAFIPWSDFSVNNISFYVLPNSNPTIEIGIYDDSDNLLESNTVVLNTAVYQFATVSLPTTVDLKAGTLYRIGIVDEQRTPTTILSNPVFNGSGIHWAEILTIPQTLPASISVTHSTGQKPVWFCLY